MSDRILAATDGAGLSEDARTRLVTDGVRFLTDGRPDPTQRVTWDELQPRRAATTTSRQTMANGTLNYIQIPATDLEESASFYERVFS